MLTGYDQKSPVHEAVACAFMLLHHGLEGLPEDSTVAILREVCTAACHVLNFIVVCMCDADARKFKRDMVFTPCEKIYESGPPWDPEWDPSDSGQEHVYRHRIDTTSMEKDVNALSCFLRDELGQCQETEVVSDHDGVVAHMRRCFLSAAIAYDIDTKRYGREVPDNVYLSGHEYQYDVERLAKMYLPIPDKDPNSLLCQNDTWPDPVGLRQLTDPRSYGMYAYIHAEQESTIAKGHRAMENALGMLRAHISLPYMEARLSSLSRSPNVLTCLPSDILTELGHYLLGSDTPLPFDWANEEFDWILQVFCHPWHAIKKHIRND